MTPVFIEGKTVFLWGAVLGLLSAIGQSVGPIAHIFGMAQFIGAWFGATVLFALIVAGVRWIGRKMKTGAPR